MNEEPQAGPALDGVIATRVLGWEQVLVLGEPHDWFWRVPGEPDDLRRSCPAYSGSIAAAWQVVEHLEELGWAVLIASLDEWVGDTWRKLPGWVCELSRFDREGREGVEVEAETVPLAVCRAALKVAASPPQEPSP